MDDHGHNEPEPVLPEDAMITQREQKPNDKPKEEQQQTESILLRDLAPRENIKGGAGKLRFGETTVADSEEMP